MICILSGATLGADLTLLPAVFASRMARISPSAADGFGLWSFVSKFTLAFAAVLLLPALERARSIDFRDSSMLRDLSVAYARLGQRGMASLITAERYAIRGNLKDAGIHAKRATGLLAEGSGPWQRAHDVLLASERAEKKRR